MNFKGRRFPLVMLGVGLSKMLLDLILPNSLEKSRPWNKALEMSWSLLFTLPLASWLFLASKMP